MSEDDLVEAIEADKALMDLDLSGPMRGVLIMIGKLGRKERWKAGRDWPAYRGLETRGLVRRTEDDADGRPTYALTKAGEKAYQRIVRPTVSVAETLFDPDADDSPVVHLPDGLFGDDDE